MSKSFIVFHDQCHDGITALWCALQSASWKLAEPYPAVHAVPPDLEKLRGSQVLLVDFCWKKSEMFALRSVVENIVVLDHHKTAAEDMADFNARAAELGLQGAHLVFDMDRSGAGLAWDELVGGPRPTLVNYVEDRDLWRFALPFSREIHAFCDTHDLTLNARAQLVDQAQNNFIFAEMFGHGIHILRYHERLARNVAKHAVKEVICDVEVPSVACSSMELVSDVGHLLAKGAPFAAAWHDRVDGTRYVSLRSEPSGMDVGAIAKALGGGGHKHAAAFTVNTAEAIANRCGGCASLTRALEDEMSRRGRLINALTGIDGIPMYSPEQEIAIATRIREGKPIPQNSCLVCGGDRVPGTAHECPMT